MGTQQGNGLGWKALLLNQSVHISHKSSERVLFEWCTGKKNQIFRSRLSRLPWSLDRKGLDVGKRPSHRLHDRIGPQQISALARRGQIQCQDTFRHKMGAQLFEEFYRGQVKRDYVSGKRIDPNEVVR